MAHHHSHGHSSQNILVALLLNAVFVVVEIAGGLWSGSIAILSDAVHDMGDCISLAVSWVLQKKSERRKDRHYSYGYGRFSLLGSVFLCGVLTVSSVFVAVHSVQRIISPTEVDAQRMLWIACVGVAINGMAAVRIGRGHSLNERAVFLHMMEDVLGWVAVLVVSVVMMFVHLPVLDPVLSLLICVWVMKGVVVNMRDTFRVLLQRVPHGVDMDEVTREIKSIPRVADVHDVHVWSMDGESHVMTLHVVVEDMGDSPRVMDAVQDIALRHGIDHTTIQCEDVRSCRCAPCRYE